MANIVGNGRIQVGLRTGSVGKQVRATQDVGFGLGNPQFPNQSRKVGNLVRASQDGGQRRLFILAWFVFFFEGDLEKHRHFTADGFCLGGRSGIGTLKTDGLFMGE
eukprot:scaffold152_cov163-Amphora_coffeaeformis.AAC.11